MAFIPNPEDKETVNHKDENKTNNHVNNLEWMTRQENNAYGTHNERSARSRSHPVKCVETGEVYYSMGAAAAAMDVSYTSIGSAIKRKGTCRGYHWEYCYENR